MYYIIGADRKEYGPVSADQVRLWIAEGRVNGQTQVRIEGQDWRPLSAWTEFADILAAKVGAIPVPPGSVPPGTPEDFIDRDYVLDIGGCIGAGWRLVMGNFGMIFGAILLLAVIQIVLMVLGMIPILNVLVSVGSVVISGPLTGGMWYFFLKNIRRQPVDLGDLFAGFRSAFGQLTLGYLTVALLTILAMLPGAAIMAYPIYFMVKHHAPDAMHVLIALAGALVAVFPAIYLGVCWTFTLPLIIDRQLEFWPAMQTSRRMVAKHWWSVLGMAMVAGLVNVAGFAACCVGLLVSIPVSLAAMMYAYETIFSGRSPEAT